MVKLSYDDSLSGVSFEGNAFTVMAECMVLIETFYKRIGAQGKDLAKSFRMTVLDWARGDFDD